MVEQIDAKSFASRWKPGTPGVIFLDVREPEELAIASIPGATHLPMAQVPQRLEELDRSSEIVVFCHHGMRSLRVAGFLEQQGYARVKNLAGGIAAWSASVDPRIPQY